MNMEQKLTSSSIHPYIHIHTYIYFRQ